MRLAVDHISQQNKDMAELVHENEMYRNHFGVAARPPSMPSGTSGQPLSTVQAPDPDQSAVSAEMVPRAMAATSVSGIGAAQMSSSSLSPTTNYRTSAAPYPSPGFARQSQTPGSIPADSPFARGSLPPEQVSYPQSSPGQGSMPPQQSQSAHFYPSSDEQRPPTRASGQSALSPTASER